MPDFDPSHLSLPMVPGGPLPEAPPPVAAPEVNPVPVVPPGVAEVRLVGPDGTPFTAKPEDAAVLLQQGWRQMDPAQAHQMDLEEKHQGVLASLKAAGQGAVETLAPVVGPALMDLAGHSYEAQRETAEMHPLAHPVGQVAGVIAPALATLGAGALPAGAKAGVQAAAKASAPEVIAGLGARAGGAVAGKGALARITQSAINQATQGAAYVGTDWLNRAVQGDPRATAEQLFSNGLGGVLFGGAVGAIGGAMSRVAGAQTGDFLESLRDLEARGGLKATGAIQGLIGKWEKQVGPERLKDIGRYLGREGGVGPFKTFEEMLQLAEDRFKRPAVDRMEQILNSVTGEKKGYGFIDEIIDEIRKDPLVQKWSRNKLDKAAYRDFESTLNGLEHDFALHDADGNITAYRAISPQSLHELSQAFADKARGWSSSLDPNRAMMSTAFDKGRFITDRRIDQMLDDVASQWGVKGNALSKAWKDAKFQYQAGRFLEDGANLGWKRGIGNNQISPMEALGAMTGAMTGHAPGAALLGTATAVARREGSAIENWGARHLGDFIEKIQSKSNQNITDAIEKIFRGSAARVTTDLAEAQREHRVTREDFPQTMSMLNRMAQDPEHVAQKVTEAFGPLVEGNGQVALALHDTASKISQALSGAVQVPQKTGPLDADYTPSPTELAAFNRQWLVAKAPETVLQRIADGSYLADDGATLQRMYPSLSEKIKKQVADELAVRLASGERIPFHVRDGLSQFLGMPLDRRTTGGAIAQAQSIYLAQAQAQQAQPAPKKVNFESSAAYATDRQASQSRLGRA